MRLASFPRFLHPSPRRVPLIFMSISYTIKNAVNKLTFFLASFCIKSTFPPAPVVRNTWVQTVGWNSWLKPRINQSSADLLRFRSIFCNSKYIHLFKRPHCKDTVTKIWNKYSQKGNCAASIPIPTFIYLWTIYIFPGSVCLFCQLWKLGTKPRSFISRNT